MSCTLGSECFYSIDLDFCNNSEYNHLFAFLNYEYDFEKERVYLRSRLFSSNRCFKEVVVFLLAYNRNREFTVYVTSLVNHVRKICSCRSFRNQFNDQVQI